MSELAQAIQEMRNMRESYDQLAATADLYQQGREALASAITAKGVPTTADTPLADMAENVGDIQQVTTTIDGGDMYAAQLFGDGVLWNLYDVLAQMKSQYMGAGHYAALIVCEYYKGYDSLQLQGADAYYTCDGDFYDYDALHTWHDANNGKANRWVCFLYQQDGARLDITNTAISPRSMYIGGHIGTIEYFVNGRLTDLVCGVEETDVVDNFLSNAYTQSWGFNCILRNVKHLCTDSGDANITIPSAGTVAIGAEGKLNSGLTDSGKRLNIANATYIYLPNITSTDSLFGFWGNLAAVELRMQQLQTIKQQSYSFIFGNATNLRVLDLRGLTRMSGNSKVILENTHTFSVLIDVIVGELVTSCSLIGWKVPNILADATKKARLIDNIKNHILARVSDRTGLSQLTFTVSTNMFNAISGETITWNDEEMTLADAFLTKNWLLAGA